MLIRHTLRPLLAILFSLCFLQVAAIGQTTSAASSPALTNAPATASAAQTEVTPGEGPRAAIGQEPARSDMAVFQDKVNDTFGKIVSAVAPVLFVPVFTVPLIVLILVAGAIFFTLYFGFINIRLFHHAVRCVRGHYDDPSDHGEITHFQALTSALSATVGLGNIAGVAVAITLGGPGAVFWMWMIAFFGMSSKFSSCTLGQLYRRVGKDEHVLGGPMVYLETGLKERLSSLGPLGAVIGKVFAVIFALFTITGSIGGGNMFQGNQTFSIVSQIAGIDKDWAWAGGLVMAVLVGVVIIGGIRRIGEVTSKLIPAMCVFYVTVCSIIILANVSQVPHLLGSIFAAAFDLEAAGIGGLVGIFIQGSKRAAFSNEAGLGSAAIAHSAAKTHEPVREGVVAMLGPFIDTIVICTMTALTILITQAHIDPITQTAYTDPKGVSITIAAFASLAKWLPNLLAVAVCVFAYSTMISWSYYGERAVEYLVGRGGILPYRIVFLFFVFLGPMVSLNNLIDFTDLMILSMAYPNIIGMILLAPKVKAMAKDYTRRLKAGEMQEYC